MPARSDFDLLIIGGGINGAGIARDAAGRGLSALLCEQGDLASATSSASTKLIHGGLRYLEYYRFGFVREALKEREVLLKIAPHIVWPARFVLPYDKGLRPAWMIEAGLLLYDWLAPRKRLGRSQRIDLRSAKAGAPLKEKFATGFVYSDCRVDDARLAVLNAADARERGALICTRTRCVSAKRAGAFWEARLVDVQSGAAETVTARALVNAAGPWAGEVLSSIAGHHAPRQLRLVKGSHIVVRRLYEGEHCYVLQNDDGRLIFVMPYESGFTLIGTTELPFSGDPAQAAIRPEELSYLTAAVSRYFRKPLREDEIIASFAGVRPLYETGARTASALTREYVLDLDAPPGLAPLISVFGGKITTYRRLAEDAVEKLIPYLKPPRPARWTAFAPLPGGDLGRGDPGLFTRLLRAQYPWLDQAIAERLARAYGTRAQHVLRRAKSPRDLGTDFGAGLTQAEIDYLIDEEFALTAEDILWRRSKLSLHLSKAQIALAGGYIEARVRAKRAERDNG